MYVTVDQYNICLLSKLILKLIASQIAKHLNKNGMLEHIQSARSHSTETGLLRILNIIFITSFTEPVTLSIIKTYLRLFRLC